MSAFLLDTCAFLWLSGEPKELSKLVATICKDAANSLLLSPISVWEIELKYRKGDLQLQLDPPEVIRLSRSLHFIESLPFTEQAALQYGRLPFHHKDPFDRMLICQALEHTIPILTPDTKIKKYEVETIW